MRRQLLVILIGLSFHSIQAQPWLDLLPKDKERKELTFFDYQHAFESYWAPYAVTDGYYIEHGEKIKAAGWKQFKRWEYMMQHRVDMRTGAFPTQTAKEITDAFFRDHPLTRSMPVSDWKSLGPHQSEGGYQGIGRMNCVAFHPDDPNHIWAGAASGGLWTTTDKGSTWTCLSDKLGVLGVTDIVITSDFTTTQTIYLATGDKNSYDNNSIGVLKSTDGGHNWFETGLTYALADRKFVYRVLQNPHDLNALIAATSDGVFLTLDGGVKWDSLLTDVVFLDMEFHPADPQIIYGSTSDGEIYVTRDAGQNWTRNLWEFVAGRTELAVSPDEPDWVYAVAARGELEGIYKSTDSGASFVKVFDGETKNLLHWNYNGIGSGGQAWYDLAIAVSPLDANTLFVGGINTWRSVDGGNSWEASNYFAGGVPVPTVHADKHNLRFHDNGDLWECNDGGIYVSHDHGLTWKDKTNGIAISQMYKLGVSALEADEIITGLQDNGSKLLTATGWQQVNGADGMEGMIDYTDNNIQYSTTQSGSLFRTFNHWENARYITPQDAGGGAWVTPFAMDPQNPNILYGGYKEIWKTENRGDTWTKVSSINVFNKLSILAVAPSDHMTIYASDTYQLWKSTTGGEPFIKLSGNIPNHTNNLSHIAVKHDDPNTLWIAVSGFTDPGVWQSVNGGTEWTDISEGLPKIPVYSVVQNKQATGEIELFAGTELGVYFKRGEDAWLPFSSGLPNVIISELEIYYDAFPVQSKLRAATYGRGLWETRFLFSESPMAYVSSTTVQANTDTVKPDQINQEILQLGIITTGDLEPMHAQSFLFTTKGSTSPSTDISSAKLFYTGNAAGFNTAVPFGEMVAQPDGQFEFHSDQPLLNGKNYFWLAYDIPYGAGLGNYLDAQWLSFNLGTELIPDVMDPDGYRVIDLIYCNAGTTNLSQDFISRILMGEIDQVSVKGHNGYQDFTNQSVRLHKGNNLEVFVTNNLARPSNELISWIDWNHDGDFEDAYEEVYASGPLQAQVYSFSVTPPEQAFEGTTRIRFRLHDTAFGANDTSCDDSNLGEVEDYSIEVLEPVSVNTINPELKFPFHLYPNPASVEITIEAPENHQLTRITILNIYGQVVFEGEMFQSKRIPISSLPSGIYTAVIDGHSRRFLKK